MLKCINNTLKFMYKLNDILWKVIKKKKKKLENTLTVLAYI